MEKVTIIIYAIVYLLFSIRDRIIWKITGWDTRGPLDRENRFTGIIQRRSGFVSIEEDIPVWETMPGVTADFNLINWFWGRKRK